MLLFFECQVEVISGQAASLGGTLSPKVSTSAASKDDIEVFGIDFVCHGVTKATILPFWIL